MGIEKEKLTSVHTSSKSITESSGLNNNSSSAPSTKPKLNLINYRDAIRDLKKQQSINQEQKSPSNSQVNTSLVIKEEPLEIMDQGDSMGFQAPGGSLKSSPTSTMVPDGKNNSQKLNISALPDDGDFESQIDSDQETVAFGETPEKNKDDEI